MKRGIWLARDKNGSLYAYSTKPLRDEEDEMFHPTSTVIGSVNVLILQHSADRHHRFPEVTWENSPVFAELDLMLLYGKLNKNDSKSKKRHDS